MSKLYYLSFKNVIWVLLLSIFFFNTSFLQERKKTNNKIRTIVIDPGHGGHDPGNLGTGRYKETEKHVALAISLKAGRYIKEAFPELEIIYTRKTNSQFLKLTERIELANNNNADLFISIHCDAFTNPTVCGSSVYVMGMSKLKANMDIAMKENSVIYLEDDYKDNYDGFDPNTPESYIIFSLKQNTHLNQSLQIAHEVEQEFINRSRCRSRGVKQAPFYVISYANMPSILIETGFLTNPKEEDYLHSTEGQDYLASSIFRAFRAYKENVEGIESNIMKLRDTVIENNKVKILNTNNEKNLEGKDTSILSNNIEELEKVVFKVQIGTYLRSMIHEKLFQDIQVEEEFLDGIYKYFVGLETNKDTIERIKSEMHQLGFEGAFIVAFYKGIRISTKEALDLQKKIIDNE